MNAGEATVKNSSAATIAPVNREYTISTVAVSRDACRDGASELKHPVSSSLVKRILPVFHGPWLSVPGNANVVLTGQHQAFHSPAKALSPRTDWADTVE